MADRDRGAFPEIGCHILESISHFLVRVILTPEKMFENGTGDSIVVPRVACHESRPFVALRVTDHVRSHYGGEEGYEQRRSSVWSGRGPVAVPLWPWCGHGT